VNLIRGFDRFLRRAYRVFEFCDDPECVLRLRLSESRRPICLPDGEIPAGSPILEIHLWNEHMPPIPDEGSDIAWASRLQRMLMRSLRAVAKLIRDDPRMAGVRAVGGVTVLPSLYSKRVQITLSARPDMNVRATKRRWINPALASCRAGSAGFIRRCFVARRFIAGGDGQAKTHFMPVTSIYTNPKGGLIYRLGFSIFPYHNPLGRFGEFWENFYTWWLMWAYNPISLRGRSMYDLRRDEIWMSVGEFMRLYDPHQAIAGRPDR